MMHHQKLADTTLDQLSLASIHYLRNHFQASAGRGGVCVYMMASWGAWGARGVVLEFQWRSSDGWFCGRVQCRGKVVGTAACGGANFPGCFPSTVANLAPQEATDIYKRLLLENRDYTALNCYVALCYYKLDYYDVSLEILAAYIQVALSPSVRGGQGEAGGGRWRQVEAGRGR